MPPSPGQSRSVSWFHSPCWPSSQPMKISFLPGCVHSHAVEARTLARFCQSSPGMRPYSEPLPCTTSSCETGRMKFSLKAHSSAERDVVVVMAAVDRVAADIRQRVVHPAHVPLEAEAEPAVVHGPRDARPGGRLLGGGERGRVLGVDDGVDLAQEVDRGEVLVAAEHVRQPLAGGPRVVEVEHRRDGVDAQAVGVELLQPVERVGDQEVAHLGAAVVEDQRAPVGMRAEPRVGVLVERRAVEAGERELVAREVPGHPVEDHADAGRVQPVDQEPQVVGRAEPRSRPRSSRSPGSPRNRRTGAP